MNPIGNAGSIGGNLAPDDAMAQQQRLNQMSEESAMQSKQMQVMHDTVMQILNNIR
ncbi:hypothetical protein [Paraburkholderia hayleyella]|uniref:hypothetical protein n=1 Tax=Paraburkholderia hayleyella TaxID=2152889 RepID=UPI001291A305|nr:hypothetical protein [Paraburkholderia hayleyella]